MADKPSKKSVALSGVVVAETALCSIDPEQGILRYRGYDIADLAEHATYEEVAYLLLEGDLPGDEELRAFEQELSQRDLPANVRTLIDGNAHDVTPLELLRTATSLLSFSDPAESAIDRENDRRKAAALIARLPTIVARHHRLRQDLDPVDPDPELSYAENFLTMLRGESPTEREARAFDVAMILHAEHELNASTFAARVVAGTGSDMHSAITAAICALKGPTHGGANEAAMRTVEEFGSPEAAPDGVRRYLAEKKTLFGFGHPVYVTTDPRARILKKLSEEFSHEGGEPNWYAITEATERAAHEQKGLWPNVDLYSGSLYRYLGIPNDLFTPLFECSRVAGQAAHVLEQHANNKIIRPAGEYVGPDARRVPVRSA
ncbi:MAG: citrate synthase [Actinobacteria bacterium]|nr:MAG: citrate synthase [Actinomycetota bacterium]